MQEKKFPRRQFLDGFNTLDTFVHLFIDHLIWKEIFLMVIIDHIGLIHNCL